MTSGGPDLGSILEEILMNGGPQAPLVIPIKHLIDDALGLFGEGSAANSGVSSSDVASMGAAVHAGDAAAAEKAASQSLSDGRQALEAIDAQLDSLAKQIVDNNDECKKKLLSVKSEVDNELKYLDTTSDSSVVQSAAVQKFLADKAGEASEVILTASAQIAKHQQQIGDVTSQYSGAGGTGASGGAGGAGVDPAAAAAVPAAAAGGYGATVPSWDNAAGGGYDGGYYDDGGSSLGDLAGMVPQMASALPGALGGLGGGAGMGNPLGDLSGLIGSAVRDASQNSGRDKPDEATKAEEAKADDAKKDQPTGATGEAKSSDEQKAEPVGATGDSKAEGGGPPPPPPTPAPTMVTRPDGTTATASSAAVAAAARAHLGGQDLMSAYKDANVNLAQPGTPIKDTIPPSRVQMGDLAAFQDRYVMCEGDGKVYLDGQSQPLSALGKLRGFLGFFRAVAPADAGAVAAPAAGAATTVAAHSPITTTN
ncbi:MAG: DUF4226 domain-containing protein [Mycolicibacterium sp.]|uniref:DUF4226 domain-containing protein n=1 Tax=Mycolicibacterium sp. TaxID=2320850 RepID=UPI003D0B7FF5